MIQLNVNEKLKDYIEYNKLSISISEIVETIIDIEKVNKNIYVSLLAIERKEIKELNCKYRNINKDTDVLSFPVFEKEDLKNTTLDDIELGDIFLCLEVIEKNSEEYNTGINRELTYMIVHGILHLLGYDHIKEEDKIIMRTKEKEVLKSLGVV